MRRFWFCAGALWTGICFGSVQAVYLDQRSDVLGGASFGAAGAYERVTAKVEFSIDPKLPANRIIRDIEYAPCNADGLVEFSANLYLLKPRDPKLSNGTLLFEVSNRGRKGLLSMFNRGTAAADPQTDADFGDKFLLEQGYTILWLGWQFDVAHTPNAMRVEVPVATDHGKPIIGLVRANFIPGSRTTSFSTGDRDHIAYPVLDPRDPSMELTVRDTPDGPRRNISRNKWSFTDATHVTVPAGLENGKIYEIVYKSQNPAIAGLGVAGVRDIVSFFKHGGGYGMFLTDQQRYMKRAIGFGTSQSGRFLRQFLYDGFNADEKGQIVFDGLWPHVGGAGRGSFNIRFAQPSRDAQPWNNFFYPTDFFPFTDLEETDPELHLTDGLLVRATRDNVVPKLFLTNGSYEYWGRDAALIHVTPDGEADARLAKDTRIYYNTGAQHGPGHFPLERESTRNLANPLDYRWQMRALLTALNAWVKDGKEPPPSQYPRLAKKQLATPAALEFPRIPGIEVARHPLVARRLDFGPEFRTKGIATIEPAKLGKPYPILVPQVNSDGNEMAGIRLPEIQVPLGTYTGWNQRVPSMGAAEEMTAFIGSFFPFARTKAERLKSKDPRPSVEERYRSREDYLDKISACGQALADKGYLLEQDVPKLVERAQHMWDDLETK
jgi:hypothetical protein